MGMSEVVMLAMMGNMVVSTAEYPKLFCIPQISQITIYNVPLCCIRVITNSVHAYLGLLVSQTVPKLARPTDKKI